MTTSPTPNADQSTGSAASAPGGPGSAEATGAAAPLDEQGQPAESILARLLGRLPNLLSSRPVILFGILLFFYLFVFAGLATLFGHPNAVSTNTQLILGNYTNVTSSVGAGIAAGASLTLLRNQRRTHRLTQAAQDAARDALAFAEETHRLLHILHPEEAAKLGQSAGRLSGERHRVPGADPL